MRLEDRRRARKEGGKGVRPPSHGAAHLGERLSPRGRHGRGRVAVRSTTLADGPHLLGRVLRVTLRASRIAPGAIRGAACRHSVSGACAFARSRALGPSRAGTLGAVNRRARRATPFECSDTGDFWEAVVDTASPFSLERTSHGDAGSGAHRKHKQMRQGVS
jgi:hypothetical protein